MAEEVIGCWLGLLPTWPGQVGDLAVLTTLLEDEAVRRTIDHANPRDDKQIVSGHANYVPTALHYLLYEWMLTGEDKGHTYR